MAYSLRDIRVSNTSLDDSIEADMSPNLPGTYQMDILAENFGIMDINISANVSISDTEIVNSRIQ